jgi:integrase/recombinase XerC
VASGRRHLQPDEVEGLLDGTSPRCPSGIRNRLLLELLYRGGVKLSEALALRDVDVESAGPDVVRLHVRGRTGCSRGVTIRSEFVAQSLLPRWCELRPAWATRLLCTLTDCDQPTGFGGPARAGQPLRPSYVRAMIARLAEKADLEPGLACPRALRRSHALHTLAEGVELHELQRRIGHSRIDTTAEYLQGGSR